ncbi:hypothetical protein CCACVL1_06855 [Corchorus capsularis]|uniref:Uncharacterized protein n=1 Tax=Corchorus capsularis TaxID=210143 RepID=A0A1R3JCE0_COCAP|nr:hypothetical protein CCACVL1_06855 [Corchorus capsularis]
MEASAPNENSSAGTDQEIAVNHGGPCSDPEIAQEEQVRGILQVISSTGKFWHNWDKLKSMLSFQLKLVLNEYPEAKMTTDQQNASLGETYIELVARLDEDTIGCQKHLSKSFKACSSTRKGWRKMSALGLDFKCEKPIYCVLENLLVTSTLTACTNPYPQMMPKPEKESDEAQPQLNSIQNGIEPMVGDRDEIMTEVEEADIEDMTIDMDAFQEMVGSKANSTAAGNS